MKCSLCSANPLPPAVRESETTPTTMELTVLDQFQAVENGDFLTLAWAKHVNGEVHPDCTLVAAFHGNIDMLKCLVQGGAYFDKQACLDLAKARLAKEREKIQCSIGC
jgi:hypothetical protein